MQNKKNRYNNIKVLNLYSGIGGNRKLWTDCDVTAVEHDKDIAEFYSRIFPDDKLIVVDAHQYLLDHFSEYEFIWSSPPCQSHSSFRQNICVRYRGTKPIYPDMRLYQEILLLKYNFDGNYVIENVKPYYFPLIQPDFVIQRHLFWSNIPVTPMDIHSEKIRSAQIPDLQRIHGFDLSKTNIKNKRQVLRNCVHPNIGNYIYNFTKKRL